MKNIFVFKQTIVQLKMNCFQIIEKQVDNISDPDATQVMLFDDNIQVSKNDPVM